MGKTEMREIILEAIGKLNLSLFYFDDIKKVIEASIDKENNLENVDNLYPGYMDILYEVIRDLIAERKISPIPHGDNAAFYINKQ